MPPEEDAPQHPHCYGQLDKVFPMSAEGMREVRDLCWNCALRVDCLRQAMADPQQRRTVAGERGQAPGPVSEAVGGVSGFLQRWSRLKKENQERKP